MRRSSEGAMRWTVILAIGVVSFGVLGLGAVAMRGLWGPTPTAGLSGSVTPRAEAPGGAPSTPVRSSGGADASLDAAAEDAVAALRAAIAANTGGDLGPLDALFAAAADADPESALEILSSLKDSRATVELHGAARPLLDAIRDDARLLERWLEIMLKADPPSAADARYDPVLAPIVDAGVVASGISALARLDSDAAHAYWLRIDPASYNVLPEEGIRTWLAFDPHALLRNAAELGRGERNRLIREWAKVDFVAAVVYAASLEDFAELLLMELAIGRFREGDTSLDQVFAAAAQMPASTAAQLRRMAIEELAKSDPDTAANRLAELDEVGRGIAGAAIARGYAERDPFFALAWAREQHLDRGEVAVVQVAAETNALRALDLALQTSERVRGQALFAAIVDSLRHDVTSAPELARRLEILSPGSRQYEAAMETLVSSWVSRKPDAALAWIAANAARLPDRAHAAAAHAAPPGTIERIAERLPPAAQAIWYRESP